MLNITKIILTLLLFSSLSVWQSSFANAKSTGWMKTREVNHFMRSLGRSNLLPTKFVCKTRSEGSGPPLVKVTYRKNSKKKFNGIGLGETNIAKWQNQFSNMATSL